MNNFLFSESVSRRFNTSIAFWITLVLTELVFFKIPYLNLFLCPIISVCLVYLYIVQGEKLLALCFTTFANDALGTVFNLVSVKYISILFLIYELFIVKQIRIKTKYLPVGIFGLYVILQPFISGLDDLNAVINVLLPLILILVVYQRYAAKEVFLEEFAYGTSVIVSLLALNACITGGYAVNDYSEVTGYVRKGILGVGIGDPNFSCLILCTGITCIINCKSFSKLIKLVLSLIIIGAIAITLSTTGFVCLCIIFLLSLLLNNTLDKRIRNIVLILLAVLLISNLYLLLPSFLHVPTIDSYISRLSGKYLAYKIGDVGDFTTGRSDLSDMYWSFINNQTLLRKLIGGNYLLQYSYFPHNTYIDFIIQFGYIGTLFIVIGMLLSLKNKFSYQSHNEYRKCTITLKILYAIFISTISVYHGTTFAVMIFILFVL